MLASVLDQFMQRSSQRYTPSSLSRLAGVPKPTIINWLTGRVARPHRWHELALVAAALRLNADEADQLLFAAGHASLANLRREAQQPDELRLLHPWQPTTPADAVALLAVPHIPAPPTPLIDRVGERACIHTLLQNPTVRLITITGTAGVGKTRLALHIAAELSRSYADGSYVVSLSDLTDPSLVLPALARTLLAEPPAELASLEDLGLALQQRQLLLVLDNCEHLPNVAALVSRLLAVAPGVRVLVTSRCVLHVAGEHEVPLKPLALPDLHQLPPLDELARVPAVALFLTRLLAIRPDFRLTDANVALVAAICVRLDGLPLAIELAVARANVLPLRDLLARLDQRLSFLTVAAADHLPHQQTLRGAFDWSYRLLPAAARRLLMRLAVFADSWSLEAAEAICAEATDPLAPFSPMHLLDSLTTLHNHSLVQTVVLGDEMRYSLIETVRAYAGERLIAGGERHALQSRHAAYYIELADRAGLAVHDPARQVWSARLHQEHANLERALVWALRHIPERAGSLIDLVARRNWSASGPALGQ